MYEDDYFADTGLEYDRLEPREELKFKFRPYVPDYAPPTLPERPEAHINDWCEGCPYPAHGFVCWSQDGDCMRQRVSRINHKEESTKYGTGANLQQG